MSRAKRIEKIISDASGEVEPKSTPIAIPLKAPCPSESEKKAILLETTIVESKPKRGVTSKIAINPLIINWYSNKNITLITDNLTAEVRRVQMEHKITVAGIGPGSIDYISPAALRAIQSAKILVGGKRALSYFATDNQKSCPITGDILAAVQFIKNEILMNNVVVMVSGDPGYYSMLDTLRRNFPLNQIEVIPSISAMQLAFARLALPWHSAELLSFHGRRPDDEKLKFTDGKILGMLTDGEYNSHTIPKILISNGWSGESKLAICARLSYDDEQIIETTLSNAEEIEIFKHCILIVRDPR